MKGTDVTENLGYDLDFYLGLSLNSKVLMCFKIVYDLDCYPELALNSKVLMCFKIVYDLDCYPELALNSNLDRILDSDPDRNLEIGCHATQWW